MFGSCLDLRYSFCLKRKTFTGRPALLILKTSAANTAVIDFEGTKDELVHRFHRWTQRDGAANKNQISLTYELNR